MDRAGIAGREHLARIARLDIGDRCAESGRIGEVGEFAAELEAQCLSNGKIAGDDEVPVSESAAVEDIAAAVAEGELLRHAEGGRVEVAGQRPAFDGAAGDVVVLDVVIRGAFLGLLLCGSCEAKP